MKQKFSLMFFLLMSMLASAQEVSDYNNPVIHADYSDPDAIRVGNRYYMIASSFNSVPALPILKSDDLVQWKLIGYALPRLVPEEYYKTVRHGGGVWAPTIRFHKDSFRIYYPDPDFGIYVIKAKNIQGPWTAPRLILEGKGLIDPCPFWDSDGKAYLVHAYAGSRAGFKNILVIRAMDASGEKIIGEPVLVFDGNSQDPTVEGPKLYKRNGYYYLFAPAGGVSTGWQLVLRSKNIFGPYERKVVLAQGKSAVNGPHQGAWVTTPKGKDWFLHFQDKKAYGRIVHLQKMVWKNDWPVIGEDRDGDGVGEPFFDSTTVKRFGSDRRRSVEHFNSASIPLAFQWQANPQEGWAFATSGGYMRMYAVLQNDSVSIWNYPNILSQKFPAEEFVVRLNVRLNAHIEGERFGVAVLGTDLAWLQFTKQKNNYQVTYHELMNAEKNSSYSTVDVGTISRDSISIFFEVKEGGVCTFSYAASEGVERFVEKTFVAKPGKWVGAKFGMFMVRNKVTNNAGYVDIDVVIISR